MENHCSKIKLFFAFTFVLLGSTFAWAQLPPLKSPPANIRSVIFEAKKANAYTPIVVLGEPLTFSFDDLDADRKIYYYRIDHCEYNWERSKLNSTDFMNGFQEERIRDFENAFNTFQPYTHYQLTLPNNEISLKISGNYLLSVLDQSRNVIFSRRFIVYQPKVDVGVSVHRSRDIQYIDKKQDVEFVINHTNLNIRDPYQDIKVAIYKNWDWNSVRMNIPPKFVRNDQLLYNYVSELSFWGDNEYLYFDTKEIRNATNNINKTRLDDIFNTYLYLDEERGDLPYTVYPDVNGNFVIRTIDTQDAKLEADYSRVHFSLKTRVDPGSGGIYIYGNFNGWQIDEENKMTLNPQTGFYENSMLFKQGFYNYLYVVADQNKQVNKRAIEGAYYQTENNYAVVVYYKQFGDRYTQVVGVGQSNSDVLRN